MAKHAAGNNISGSEKAVFAKILYGTLEKHQKEAVDGYLTTKEKEKLCKNNSQDLAGFSREKFLKTVIFAVNQFDSLNKKPHNLAKLVGMVTLLPALVALAFENLQMAAAFFVYAVGLFLLIRRKPISYWQLRFSLTGSEPLFLILTVFAFLVSFISAGVLSLEAYSARVSLLVFIQAVLWGPFFEEIFFRDYLFEVFSTKQATLGLSFAAPVLFSSVAFAISHFSWQTELLAPELAAYAAAGFALGSLRFITRSLVYSIAAHSMANAALLFL